MMSQPNCAPDTPTAEGVIFVGKAQEKCTVYRTLPIRPWTTASGPAPTPSGSRPFAIPCPAIESTRSYESGSAGCLIPFRPEIGKPDTVPDLPPPDPTVLGPGFRSSD